MKFPKGTPESILKYIRLVKLYMYQWTWHKILTSVINGLKPFLINGRHVLHFPFIFAVDGEEEKMVTCSYTNQNCIKRKFTLNKEKDNTLHTYSPDGVTGMRACVSCVCNGDSGYDIISKKIFLKNTKLYSVKHRQLYVDFLSVETKKKAKEECQDLCIHPVPLLLAEIDHFDLFESLHIFEELHITLRMGEHLQQARESVIQSEFNGGVLSDINLKAQNLWKLIPRIHNIGNISNGFGDKLSGKDYLNLFKLQMFVDYAVLPEQLLCIVENEVLWAEFISFAHWQEKLISATELENATFAFKNWAYHTMEHFSHTSPTQFFFPKFHSCSLLSDSIKLNGLPCYYSTNPREHSYINKIKKLTPYASNSNQITSLINGNFKKQVLLKLVYSPDTVNEPPAQTFVRNVLCGKGVEISLLPTYLKLVYEIYHDVTPEDAIYSYKSAKIQNNNKSYRIVADRNYQGKGERFDGILFKDCDNLSYGKLKYLLKVKNYSFAFIHTTQVINTDNILNCKEIELKSTLLYPNCYSVVPIQLIYESVHLVPNWTKQSPAFFINKFKSTNY